MAKKKSYVPIGKIKRHLRRLSIQRPEYSKAKNRARIDKALYACENVSCDQLTYEGTCEKRFTEFQEKYVDKNLQRGKMELDHIIEVVDITTGFIGWDEYINRLFCGPEELKVLCNTCHSGKSKEEMQARKKAGSLRRKKK